MVYKPVNSTRHTQKKEKKKKTKEAPLGSKTNLKGHHLKSEKG